MYPKIIGETDGDVLGSASSTDEAIVRFDGTTGDVLQDSPHFSTDIGELYLRTTTNSINALVGRNATYYPMLRFDTRDPSVVPSGSARYILGAFTPSSGFVGSNTGTYGLAGSLNLISGSQTYPIYGLNGTVNFTGSITSNQTHRGGYYSITWQSTGALTGTLMGQDCTVVVGSSTSPIGNVTQLIGTRGVVGFMGNQNGAVTTSTCFYVQTPYNTAAGRTIATNYGTRTYDQKPTGVTTGYGWYVDNQSAGGYVMYTNEGIHSFGGAMSYKRTATAIDYLTTINDYLVAVTSTAAPRTITLSSAAFAQGTASRAYQVVIKDESGGAAANNITVATEGAELIDGAATYVIAQNYGTATFYSTGTSWHVL